MKISIKFSILSILLILLLGISLCIVGINYFVLNKILIQTTKDSINYASGKVSEQIARYLQPLNQRSYVGAGLIEEGTVAPASSLGFIRFLRQFISGQANISAVYWADEAGNFYLLEKSKQDRLNNKNIIVSAKERKIVENIYDLNMNLLDSKEGFDISFDPRLRPWYQQVKFNKQYSWLVYPMVHVDTNQTELGLTAAYPVYGPDKKLRGVFGIDVPLEVISTFIKSIHITKNSVIFICDSNGNLFSAYSAEASLLRDYKMPKVADIKLGWVGLSFDLYTQKREPIFIFDYENEKYIAAYDKIPDVKSESYWNVAIVTPVQDVIAPLQRNILLSFALISVALIICMALAAIFSSRISRPIVKLAEDAELICQLRLEEIKQLFSMVKEIDYMAKSFIKMKSALHSFQRYMPIALVKKLVLSGKVAEVGGEMKEITLLFSDIEDFTPISEKMSPPQVMQYLSEYFQVLTKIIISTSGTVDKYMGDSLMAFWGAPIDDAQHSLHACQAALQIRQALKELNSKWRSENKPQLHTRIGISTDRVVVGNVGSDDRLNYTALGDGVNLASRLEGLNKNYGISTMVGEYTYNLVKDHFKFRLIDRVAVKGKAQGIYVYELLGENAATKDQQLEEYNQVFYKAFKLYEQGRWEEARNIFLELVGRDEKDQLPKIFIERCQVFLKNPPLVWDGTWVMEHK